MFARVARTVSLAAAPVSKAAAPLRCASTCAYKWEDPLNYESLLTDEEVMIRVRVATAKATQRCVRRPEPCCGGSVGVIGGVTPVPWCIGDWPGRCGACVQSLRGRVCCARAHARVRATAHTLLPTGHA